MRSRSHQRRRNRLSKKTQTRRKSRMKSRSKNRSRRRLRLSGGRNRSLAADVATGAGVTAAVGVSAFTAVTAARKLKQLQDEYVHNFKTGFSALVESPEFLLNDLNITLVEKDLLERRFDECLTLLKRITKHNDAYSIFRKYVWLDKETQDKLISYMHNILITKDWQKIEEYIKKIPNLTVQQKSIFWVKLNSLTPGHVLATFTIPPHLKTVLVRDTPDESPVFKNFKKRMIMSLSESLNGEYGRMAIQFNESVRSLLDGLLLTSREQLETYLLNGQLALALSQLKRSSNKVSGVEYVIDYFYLHSDLIKPQLTQLLYTYLFDIDGQHWLTGLKTQYDYNEFVSRQFQTWFENNPVSQTITPNNLFFPKSLPQPALTLIKTPLLTSQVPVPRNYFMLFRKTFLNRLSTVV